LAAVGGVVVAIAVGLWSLSLGLDWAPRRDARAALEAAARRAENEAFTSALVTRQETVLQVARGESLALVLARAGAPWSEINGVVAAVGELVNPRRMRAGQDIDVYFQPEGDVAHLTGLAFRAEPGVGVTVGRDAQGAYWAREIVTPWSLSTDHVVAKIDGSLYQSALAAGATEKEVAAISEVFSYDIDFQRDIYPGDTFELLFDRYFDEDGRTIKTGDLYFVSLNTRHGPRAYYYFQGPDDREGAWYDHDGRSARKFLMKTPIDGARLSSSFGMRRHPILGYSMMHRGVDFAAPYGTPIRAAGDGVVVRAGPFGSYGNYVRLRHLDSYDTAYAHMSRFAPGIRPGVRVRQGQVIGYVGATGRATGAHLHYEVLYRNAQINPMKLKLATGRNLAGRDLALFDTERDRVDALRAGRAPAAPMVASAASARLSPDLRGGLE
jgi:murein DD-endopeptidase MepM/ murein hydrolase activator NlpD